MAVTANTVWEVRAAGSDNNGAGFDPTLGGTDYTLQNSPHFAFTDLASANGTSSTPTVTSASYTFTAADVGNIIHTTAGTNWTHGRFQITSVSAGAATLSSAVGTSDSLNGGTGNLGGAASSPGSVNGNMVGGNIIYIKNDGSVYSITSASTNISNGCLSLPAGVSNQPTRVIGYQTNRIPFNADLQPTLKANAITSATIVGGAVTEVGIQNLIVDGNNGSSNTAFGSN